VTFSIEKKAEKRKPIRNNVTSYNGRKIHDIERHKICAISKNSLMAFVDDGNESNASYISFNIESFALRRRFFLFAITMKHFVTLNVRDMGKLHHPGIGMEVCDGEKSMIL
jgi:hypothetical protein